MKTSLLNLRILFFACLASSQLHAQILPYKDSNLPVETRVKDLLSRMTAEEKFYQVFMIAHDGVFQESVNPSGKLPITFPRHEGQLPLSYWHEPTGRGSDYIDGTGLPLFPFGYGKSYTSFLLTDVNANEKGEGRNKYCEVSIKLKNTGAVAGSGADVCSTSEFTARGSRSKVERISESFPSTQRRKRIDFPSWSARASGIHGEQ